MNNNEKNCNNCDNVKCAEHGTTAEPCHAYFNMSEPLQIEDVTIRELARQILSEEEVMTLLERHAQLNDDTSGEDNNLNLRAIERRHGNIITLYNMYNTTIWVHTVLRDGVNVGTFIYTAEER